MAISINLKIFKAFFRSGSIGGILLFACVAISLLLANSPFGQAFQSLLSTQIGYNFPPVQLQYTVSQWINDGLMAVFFLMVGLEIKRALLEGELSTFKQASLPVFAAFGGAIVPALIYLLFNHNTAGAGGWGIPMATDIAFALAVLSILGKKAPSSLKIFLAALAIVDDLIAILVIAIFYSAEIHFDYLLYAGIVLAFMILANRLKIKSLAFYIIPAIPLWYFIHHSGIHATIAGVLVALTIPTTVNALESPCEKLEHFLTKPVNYIIMPIFALANTNITIEAGTFNELYNNLGLGIIIGLFLGKPIGITLTSWIVVKLGWGALPAKVKWIHIVALGFLGGIGFTMSVFIALLSFTSPEIQTSSKVAVLIGSTISGIIGYILFVLLRRISRE